MSGTYENIAPTITLRGIDAENLVNTVALTGFQTEIS